MHKLLARRCEVFLLGLLLAIGLFAAGCYVRAAAGPGYADFEVDGPPPVVADEVVVASPGPGYFWVGGWWDWDPGVRHYVWRAGRWERPPHPEARWVGPHYQYRNGRHYYARGHWDRGGRDRDRDRERRDHD